MTLSVSRESHHFSACTAGEGYPAFSVASRLVLKGVHIAHHALTQITMGDTSWRVSPSAGPEPRPYGTTGTTDFNLVVYVVPSNHRSCPVIMDPVSGVQQARPPAVE